MLSNHHAHLSREICQTLFGYPELTVHRQLGSSEFAAKETVTLVGPKGKIEGIRVLGSVGKKEHSTQVELFKSDCFVLGVDAPVRDSGDLADAAPLTLVGTVGEVTLEHCAIIALRHIHMGGKMMEMLGVSDREFVSVKAGGERGLVFNRVLVRRAGDSDKGYLHLDMEEGNAACIKNGDMLEVFVTPDS